MSEQARHAADAAGRFLTLLPSDTRSLTSGFFTEEIRRQGLRFLRRELFSVPDEHMLDLEGVGEAIVSHRYGGGVELATQLPGRAIALLEARRGSVTVEIAAASPEQADAACEHLAECLGATQEAADEISLQFWALSQRGPRPVRRRVSAPAWSDIADNYADETSQEMMRLIAGRVPESGRLILWNGPPGTGKTHALRALSRAWGEWCSTHYITDPEALLGHGTSYLLDVLTAEDSARAVTSRWKLVVLEDSGELLSVDAHERTGQALSRLLNTTDGVLGQETKAIVLVTTNEPLGRLHPAIQRPGRCWSQVEFSELSTAEANHWLVAHGSEMRVTGSTSLAELYAMLRGHQVAQAQRTFGFGLAS